MTGTSGRGQRSVYLDALRAVALVRVVVYHATTEWWVTAFTAMPLMFFIAGSLYAASLERRAAPRVIRDRYRRILVPYWVYLAAMVALWGTLGVLGQLSAFDWVSFVFPVLSPNGPQGPGAGTALELTWFALWYIQMHLILSAVGPLLRRAQQRHGRVTWASIVVLFVIAAVVAPPLAIAIFYVACWIVGYYQHDGWLEERLRTTWVAVCAVCGPVGLVAFVGFHSSAPVVAALGVGLLGAFWLSLALGARPWIEPYLCSHPVHSVVNWFSQRSLTVYLWHGVVLYACLEIPLPGGETWVGKLAWCLVLLPIITLVVGWAEDVAARRSVQLWPRLRRTAPVPTAMNAGTAAGTDTATPSSGPAELDLRDAVPEPGREPS